MIRINELQISLDKINDTEYIKSRAAKRLKISPEKIEKLTLFKRSIDARKKDNVQFSLTVDVSVNDEQNVLSKIKDSKINIAKSFVYEIPKYRKLDRRPVIVGFGPAGMFAGLLLARSGQEPIVIERGSAVEERQREVNHFWETGELNINSNVQFGEGGAGTFSDGKLTTGTKDKRARFVLEQLVQHGAPEDILTNAHPHIGTDKLPFTVKNIREEIIRLGGEVRFNSCLKSIKEKNGAVSEITVADKNGEYNIDTDKLILAIGHSARDTYEMLYDMQLMIAQKPFSVGARIEHRQELINKSQFGRFYNHQSLSAAEYKLSTHLSSCRGVYTFCMCPGGQVVAAASEENMVVTNGMSVFARDGENANSALLVGVGREDFGSEHPLAGMHYQRELEKAAFILGGKTYRAPAQRVEDFLNGRKTKAFGDVTPSYTRGVVPENLDDCLPKIITDSMRQGIVMMDKRLKGFNSPDAVLTGVETRSSAPIRLLRDDSCECLSLKGLYPCGEGAGYAGGIVSAAVDGLRCAEAVMRDAVEE